MQYVEKRPYYAKIEIMQTIQIYRSVYMENTEDTALYIPKIQKIQICI